MCTIGVGDEDVVAVFISNFALCCAAERGKRDAKENGDLERFH
jgi:hypothetical protein